MHDSGSFEKVCDFTSLLFFLAQLCNKILFTRKNVIIWTGHNVYNYHIIVTMKIDSVQITSVRKAGLTIYESMWLGTQESVRCPYYPVSV